MTPVDITAYTATNAAGTGRAALHRALVERHIVGYGHGAIRIVSKPVLESCAIPTSSRWWPGWRITIAAITVSLSWQCAWTGSTRRSAAPGNVMAAVGALSLPPRPPSRASARPSARIAARMRTAPCRLISATSRCRSLHAVPIVVQQLFGAHLDGVLDGATGGHDRPTPIADALSGVMLRV